MSQDGYDEQPEPAELGDVVELMSAAVRRLRKLAASAFDRELGSERREAATEGLRPLARVLAGSFEPPGPVGTEPTPHGELENR